MKKLTPKNTGASQLACDIITDIVSTDGMKKVASNNCIYLASLCRKIQIHLKNRRFVGLKFYKLTDKQKNCVSLDCGDIIEEGDYCYVGFYYEDVEHGLIHHLQVIQDYATKNLQGVDYEIGVFLVK